MLSQLRGVVEKQAQQIKSPLPTDVVFYPLPRGQPFVLPPSPRPLQRGSCWWLFPFGSAVTASFVGAPEAPAETKRLADGSCCACPVEALFSPGRRVEFLAEDDDETRRPASPEGKQLESRSAAAAPLQADGRERNKADSNAAEDDTQLKGPPLAPVERPASSASSSATLLVCLFTREAAKYLVLEHGALQPAEIPEDGDKPAKRSRRCFACGAHAAKGIQMHKFGESTICVAYFCAEGTKKKCRDTTIAALDDLALRAFGHRAPAVYARMDHCAFAGCPLGGHVTSVNESGQRPASQFKWCGACKAVRYCSVGCQKADWPVHKPMCWQKH